MRNRPGKLGLLKFFEWPRTPMSLTLSHVSTFFVTDLPSTLLVPVHFHHVISRFYVIFQCGLRTSFCNNGNDQLLPNSLLHWTLSGTFRGIMAVNIQCLVLVQVYGPSHCSYNRDTVGMLWSLGWDSHHCTIVLWFSPHHLFRGQKENKK